MKLKSGIKLIINYLFNLATVILFEILILYFTLKGLYSEALSSNYQPVLLGEASYVGIILAIFFTLYVIPIQNIVGKYSQEFLKRVIVNRSYIISFILLTLSLFYNLAFALFGSSKSIAIASFILTFFATLILGYLVVITAKILDIRNLIKDFTEEIKKYLRIEIPFSQKENYRKFKSIPQIDNSLTLSMSKFEVPAEVIESLRERILPILGTVTQSIRNEQLEIFRAGIRAIAEITTEYIDQRIDYGTYNDSYLTFIVEQFIIMKDLAQESTNQKLLPEIILAAKSISLKCLEARPIRSDRGENSLIIGFTNLLKDICLSKELFKETSYAPSLVCSSLSDIGVAAINHEYPQEAQHSCISHLSRISQLMISLQRTFPDYVSNMANHGIMKIVNHSLITLDSMRIDRSYLLESALDDIDKIMSKFIDTPADYYRMSTVLSPFFGAMADNGIAQIFGRALSINYKNKRSHDFILKILEKLLQNLNQLITFKILPSKRFLEADEVLEHLYQIGIFLIQFQYHTKNKEHKNQAKKILENNIFLILINMIKGSISIDKNWRLIGDLYSKTFGLIGMLIFESLDKKRVDDFDIAENSTEKIVEFVNTLDQIKSAQNKDRDKLLSFIRLSGTWLLRKDSKNELLQKIIKLVAFVEPRSGKSFDIILPFSDTLYPRPTLSFGAWYPPRPMTAFYPYYWGELDKYLNDNQLKKAFEKRVNQIKQKNNSVPKIKHVRKDKNLKS